MDSDMDDCAFCAVRGVGPDRTAGCPIHGSGVEGYWDRDGRTERRALMVPRLLRARLELFSPGSRMVIELGSTDADIVVETWYPGRLERSEGPPRQHVDIKLRSRLLEGEWFRATQDES